MSGCQYLGPDYDPRTHVGPTPYCGKPTLTGKSYCAEHYHVVYQKGTTVNGKRKEKEIEKEIAELKRQQEIEEIENA